VNFAGGFARDISPQFALQVDYSFNRYGLKGEIFQVTDVGGSHTQQNIFLNAVFFTNSIDESSLYLLGGGGATHRRSRSRDSRAGPEASSAAHGG
jgi:hypothetical protein